MASASVASVNIGGLGSKAFVQGDIASVAPVVPPPMIEIIAILNNYDQSHAFQLE